MVCQLRRVLIQLLQENTDIHVPNDRLFPIRSRLRDDGPSVQSRQIVPKVAAEGVQKLVRHIEENPAVRRALLLIQEQLPLLHEAHRGSIHHLLHLRLAKGQDLNHLQDLKLSKVADDLDLCCDLNLYGCCLLIPLRPHGKVNGWPVAQT